MVNQPPPKPNFTLRSYAWFMAMVGFLLLAGSAIIYFFDKNWALSTQIGAGIGGVLLLGAVLLRPDAVRTALTGRSARYASNAAIVSLAFIGIMLFINLLAMQNDWEIDVTKSGQFTLSEQTIKILQAIDTPVQVMGFFQRGDARLAEARHNLERYSRYSPNLTYEFHDPNIEPALAQSFNLNDYGLVFLSDSNQYETSETDEQSLTSALIRVRSNDQKALYFISGHGEHNLDDNGPEGFYNLKQALERENYQVESLDLANVTDTLPDDAAALILAGADRALQESESQLISEWMAAGGKLMLLTDPLEPAPLTPLLQEYGLALDNDFVVEDPDHALVVLAPQGLMPQLMAPRVTTYPHHKITYGLDNFQSFFPFARSLSITPQENAPQEISPLVSTSDWSWAETDLEAPQPEYNEGVDLVGPLHLGVAAEDYEDGSRLVVFGNAGFVTNQNVSPQMANMDLFVNAVNWLTEEEALISIRPKRPENRRVFATSLQISLTLFISVMLIPAAVFAVGLVVWWKRR